MLRQVNNQIYGAYTLYYTLVKKLQAFRAKITKKEEIASALNAAKELKDERAARKAMCKIFDITNKSFGSATTADNNNNANDAEIRYVRVEFMLDTVTMYDKRIEYMSRIFCENFSFHNCKASRDMEQRLSGERKRARVEKHKGRQLNGKFSKCMAECGGGSCFYT